MVRLPGEIVYLSAPSGSLGGGDGEKATVLRIFGAIVGSSPRECRSPRGSGQDPRLARRRRQRHPRPTRAHDLLASPALLNADTPSIRSSCPLRNPCINPCISPQIPQPFTRAIRHDALRRYPPPARRPRMLRGMRGGSGARLGAVGACRDDLRGLPLHDLPASGKLVRGVQAARIPQPLGLADPVPAVRALTVPAPRPLSAPYRLACPAR